MVEGGKIIKSIQKKPEKGLREYQDLFVGSRAFSKFIQYEVITGLFSHFPGALGLFLRQKLYKGIFQRMGKGVVLGRGMTLRCSVNIEIGNQVTIDDNCLLSAYGDSKIRIEDGVFIGRNTIIRAKGGEIRIGKGSNIGANCIVATDGSLTIGENVLIAAFTYLIGGGNYDYSNREVPIINQDFVERGMLRIMDGVWIGAGVNVRAGVTIGKGAIIGAGAVVTNDIPDFSVASGVPAKVVKKR